MSAMLLVVSGPDKGRSFPLQPGQTLQVGRSQATTTKLTDPTVSRVHCEVDYGRDPPMLINISNSGTMVNGLKIVEEQPLNPGDVIRVGTTELRYVAGSSAESPTLGPAATPKPVASSEPLAELVGRKLHHFAIESIIAKGASGMVFKATDTKKGETVALKVLQPEFSKNEEEMQRFIRAMKTMLPIRHPNIITLHEAGKTGPHCWIAMEFVDGEALTHVIKRIGVANMLDWRYAFRVAVHIARALEYAHGQSIIHRNVTPTNILLRSSDKVAKLGDLMLAKALEGTLAQQITRPGEILGDIAYMAPERTRGTIDVDGRADLYGLGATAYALVTGRAPFSSGSVPDMIHKIRTAEPEKPKRYQLSIPDPFQGAILKLLAKRPEERFATATDLLVELDRVGKFAGVAV
jgi:serine/threonine protein kinase